MNGLPLRVVLLTPPGRGAVATVRVEGSRACERVDTHFQSASKRPVADLPADRLSYGRFRLGEGVFDEVVIRRPEKDAVEIHCHGGPAVVERLMGVLAADGGERISAADWLRAFHPSRIVAAAHAALGKATTLRAAAILLDQYHGALDRALQEILDRLNRGETQAASERIQRLLAVAPCGCHLARPWRVVLTGRPNVGKSSLVNALVGYGRAIVHETPGTTRDVVTARTALDGWPVELCDTAGLRPAEKAIEREGIALAEGRLETASLVILVFDAGEPWSAEDRKLCSRFSAALVVFNKIDLVERPMEGRPWGLDVSAKTGEGVDGLIAAIGNRLVPDPPVAGEAVPFLDEHATVLRRAAEALQRGDTAEARRSIASIE